MAFNEDADGLNWHVSEVYDKHKTDKLLSVVNEERDSIGALFLPL
jgi:hypothetical protein